MYCYRPIVLNRLGKRDEIWEGERDRPSCHYQSREQAISKSDAHLIEF